MTAPTSPSPPPAAPAKGLDRPMFWHRVVALLFVVAGSLLLAANLHLLPAGVQRAVAWGWPVVLMAGGVWVLVAGRSRGDASVPALKLERGAYTAGEAVINTGTADLQVRAVAAGDHLALGQWPSLVVPAVTSVADRVQLRLGPRWGLPFLSGGAWALELAPDLPWALRWQSSLGDVQLDLRDLQLASADLRSAMGHVDLTLPARGQADLTVQLGLGNLTVRVPEAMAVKVKVSRGRLATVQPDARRFVELAPGEWSTPLFAVSPARCTVTVSLWAGDLTLV